MTDDVIFAHLNLTTILESLAKAWALEIENEKRAIAALEAEFVQQKATTRLVSLQDAMKQRCQTACDVHRAKIEDLKKRIKQATAGYLALNKAEAEQTKAFSFVTPELIEMARLVGRLEIID